MARDLLTTVERASLGYAVVLALGAGALAGTRPMIAVLAGGVLGAANFFALRRLAARLMGAGSGGALVPALGLKMVALCVAVWLAIGPLALDVLPFVLGMSTLVLACISSGLRHGLAERGG